MGQSRGSRDADALYEALTARASDGGREAFESLVRREGPRLLATARRIVDAEADARDCVQETFLLAYRRMDQFEGRAKVGSWLHRILVNVALGRVRARSRRPEQSLDALMPQFDERACRVGEPRGPAPPDAQTLIERDEVRVAVRDAIAHLPEQHRQVVVMRDIEGRSTAETAAALGVSENTAKVRLHRARAALKRLLEPAMGVRRQSGGVP